VKAPPLINLVSRLITCSVRDAAYCYRCSVVYISVCLFVGDAKTAELIEMLLAVLSIGDQGTVYWVGARIP